MRLISDEEYARRLAAQDGRCLICGRPPQTRRLHVDHDHKTGQVRGLLCYGCNRYVVWVLEHYGPRVPRAQRYLEGRLRKPPREIV